MPMTPVTTFPCETVLMSVYSNKNNIKALKISFLTWNNIDIEIDVEEMQILSCKQTIISVFEFVNQYLPQKQNVYPFF